VSVTGQASATSHLKAKGANRKHLT